MEDRKLIRLLNKDPDVGMEQLMNQYAGLVYAVVKGKMVDFHCVSSDIDDCVADVFSRFYFRLSDYDPSKASLQTYLCVLARNLAIDRTRKRSLYDHISMDDDKNLLTLADDVIMDDVVIEEELRREVVKAIEALGHPDCDIIFRKYYYGQTSKEIAHTLGLSVANVDTRTHRAILKLRKMFGGEES